MSEFILEAALFSDEPVERDVVLNQTNIDEITHRRGKLLASDDKFDQETGEALSIPEPQTITFLLLPVTSTIDVEYTKMRGHNDNRFQFTPRKGKGGENETKFEPMERVVRNDQELKAITWVAKKLIMGWRTFKNSKGQDVVFNGKNLDRLCGYSHLIEPAVREAYAIAEIKDEVESGNSETSFAGSASPSEDQNGENIGETADSVE